MSHGSRLLQRLRQTVLHTAADHLSDGQLLEQYLNRREESAFALLLRRHGPMVLGVCRRVLRQEQDAEDAFQATFLVLARRASTIEPRERVGAWLYGVAYRTALKARTLSTRRNEVERQAAQLAGTMVEARDPDDWRPLLDKHLNRLPECYRVPLILCDLEGRARKEVAVSLGLPEGTLSSRLARARALLGRRLGRHGVALSAVAALLAHEASASVPAALTAATSASVFSLLPIPARILILTEGVLKAMTLSKLKIATAVLLVLVVFGLGGGVLTHRVLADKPAAAKQEAGKNDKKGKEEVGPTVLIVVKSVDAGKHTLTGSVGNKKEREEKTYELAKDVSVILNDGLTKGDKGKDGSLSDVAPGRHVELQLTVGGKTVSAITIRPWQLFGGVKKVDAGKRTITVTSKNEKGEVEETYTLAKEARVLLNDGLTKGGKDQEGKLADLTEGTPVHLRVSAVDPKTVIEVRPQGKAIHGELKGVDGGNNLITVTYKDEHGLNDKELTVAKNAHISIDSEKGSREAKLSDLPIGSRVNVQLSVFDPAKAVRISVLE